VSRRARVIGSVLVISAWTGLLTGCSDATEDYCGVLDDQRQALTELAGAGSGSGSVTEILDVIGLLREASPEDLRDEWDTLFFAWEGLVEAFQAAGVTPQDYRPGETNGDLTEAEDQAIQGAAADLRSARVVEAARGIEQHADEVCDVDLGL